MSSNVAAARERDVTSPNRRVVLQSLLDGGVQSRVQIARETGLAPASVNRLVGSLVEAGFALEAGSDQATGGRPSMLLKFNPNVRNLLALDVTETSVKGAVLNLAGDVVERFSTSTVGLSPERTMLELGNFVAQQLELRRKQTDEEGNPLAPFSAIGISVPGPVDVDGTVTVAPALGWDHLPLGEILQMRIGHPVHIENDMNLFALAEWDGEYEGLEGSLAVLGVYHGIGLGIVEGGRIWRGQSGAGGQMGRMYMDVAGFSSKAHREFGQMEALLGASALRDRAIRDGLIPATSRTADPLFALAVRGDPTALKFVRTALRGYAFQIANVCAVLAPNTLVMAGLFETWADLVIPILEGELSDTVLNGPQLARSGLGDDAKLVGAGLFALEQVGGVLALV